MHQSSNIKVESIENTDSLLVFKINDTLFCTHTKSVMSIAQPQAIYKIPLTPKSIAGITVFQGDPVPVFCLGTYLGETIDTRRNGGVIVYVKTNRQIIGVWVDETSDIIEVTGNDYIEPDDVVKSELVKYCVTYNDKILLYLDFEFLNISQGAQNKTTSLPSFSVVQKPGFDTKTENSLFSIEQLNQDIDSPAEQSNGPIANSQLTNENINELAVQNSTTAFNKEESAHLSSEIPVSTSVEVIDRDDDSSINIKTEIDSVDKLDEGVPAIKTDKLSADRSQDTNSYKAGEPAIKTQVTSTGECLSKQSSSLNSQIHSKNHPHPERYNHSPAYSDEYSIRAEDRVRRNSIQQSEQDTTQRTTQNTEPHTTQLAQSTDSQKEESFSKVFLSLLAFGMLLAILVFNMSSEKDISNDKQEANFARIKNDTNVDQEKIKVSEAHKAEVSTANMLETPSPAGVKKQPDEKHPVNTNSTAEKSKLNSSIKPASVAPAKKPQVSEKKLVPTKKPVTTVKSTKSAPEKPYSNQEREKEKTVIVELSSETFQIVVERFRDHRQQLSQRSKHKKPAAEILGTDTTNNGKAIVSQVTDTSVSEQGTSQDIVATLPKRVSSAKELSDKPNHSNAVVTEELSEDRPSLSKFEEFRYVVTRGDTLWDIAAKFLGDPFKYKLLSEYSHVRDPNWIYPGDVVIIRKKIQ